MTEKPVDRIVESAMSNLPQTHWFNMYRWSLAFNDWFGYMNYSEKHESYRSMELFPRLMGCKTKMNEFVINYN